jgi:hypothetical protein
MKMILCGNELQFNNDNRMSFMDMQPFLNKTATFEAGNKSSFHANSGLIVANKASIK